MQIEATSPDDYLQKIPEDRKQSMSRLRATIKENLPEGFQETMSYGMIGYVIPHDIYPAGYHCSPELPLPFMSIASQKNFIAIYHMGIYTNKDLLDWFVREFPKHSKLKLDMGKSCIRFKKPEQIPFELIGELATKMTCEEWIKIYESKVKP
ncbi:uncharacterized protein DUF1801 [Gillisia mitskevichiae]|uniref:Uncharacterized protein DUF1801 n=1 Tax=Gillisia mitskevichiae TaxID=270921 RepID=A0A495PM13_9FLAO|nr:DUF1801 domain-containing protein [Gillisia mitskevichiae]RKS50735.1 uncharacterized protein DUF1801 [Gillisia mitskevichiae]